MVRRPALLLSAAMEHEALQHDACPRCLFQLLCTNGRFLTRTLPLQVMMQGYACRPDWHLFR